MSLIISRSSMILLEWIEVRTSGVAAISGVTKSMNMKAMKTW
jgi:hypothetical protein